MNTRSFEHKAPLRCILSACVTDYTDTRQKMARVSWLTLGGRQGETIGPPYSLHMQALLLRALREGVNITREGF